MFTPWSTPHNSNSVTEDIQKQKYCNHYVTYFTFLPPEELTATWKQTEGADGPAVRDNDRHI